MSMRRLAPSTLCRNVLSSLSQGEQEAVKRQLRELKEEKDRLGASVGVGSAWGGSIKADSPSAADSTVSKLENEYEQLLEKVARLEGSVGQVGYQGKGHRNPG